MVKRYVSARSVQVSSKEGVVGSRESFRKEQAEMVDKEPRRPSRAQLIAYSFALAQSRRRGQQLDEELRKVEAEETQRTEELRRLEQEYARLRVGTVLHSNNLFQKTSDHSCKIM